MQVWPAIDLRGGRCVRLQQGDYQRETVFGDDPAAIARHWVAQGAACLHLVDLDAARDGQPANAQAVRAIIQAAGVPIQLGGGIRDEAAIDRWLQCGVARLVVGTQALRDADWFRRMCRRFPGQLALGVDARDGLVATHGWRSTSQTRATELVDQFRGEPLAAVIYTDVQTDGMLQGPNLPAVAELLHRVASPLIASGGVTTADDVAALARLGVSGCIIGRALYEGRLELRQALAAARAAQSAGSQTATTTTPSH
jgi:phosphoribosylformimino-5-aminoimidazole carboxamide ribotide isomerase